MNVGFYHVDKGKPEYDVLLRALVASVRRTMRGVRVVQMTDEKSPAVAGVDDVVRHLQPEPLALGCVKAYASCAGEWIFCDTDVLFLADARSVFDQEFDVAVATREGTLLPKEVGTGFMNRNRFNKGVVYSRSMDFWQAAVQRCEQMSSGRQEWMGDQLAMCEIIASGQFRVAVLDNAYNYPPRSKNDDLSGKAAVHFKGKRKAWMLERAA